MHYAIYKLEPVEYEYTYKLIDQNTTDTAPFHQCGCTTQSVHQIAALKASIICCKIGEDGIETISCLKDKAIVYTCSYTKINT